MVLENVPALTICAAITTHIHTLLRATPNHFTANKWVNCIYLPADNPEKSFFRTNSHVAGECIQP